MSLRIELKDTASAEIARLHRALAPERQRDLMTQIGRSAEQSLRAWWERRDATTPNKRGWPQQHFWSRIAHATEFDPSRTTADSATVLTDYALSAKVNGATIRATGAPAKNLAIPLQAAVYGQRPSGNPVPGLFFIRKQGGAGGYLVTRDGAGEGARLVFWYRLIPEVTVPKDPQALPPLGELGDALASTARDFFARAARGNGGEN